MNIHINCIHTNHSSPPLLTIISKFRELILVVQLLSCVRLFETPWTAAHQASLSITNSRSLLRLMSIESGMPSNHLILCCPRLLPPSIFPSIRVFSNQSVLRIRWPKYWSSSFSISPSKEYSGLISFRMDWLDLLGGRVSKGLSRVFSNTTVQKHQFFGAQLSLWSNSHPYMTTGKTIALTRWTFAGLHGWHLMTFLGLCLIWGLANGRHRQQREWKKRDGAVGCVIHPLDPSLCVHLPGPKGSEESGSPLWMIVPSGL